MRPQAEFIHSLITIGQSLCQLPDKESKTNRLYAELARLNRNLPARVWLPNQVESKPHFVVRIPETCASVLNSKDKAPYIIYVEVLEVQDIASSPVPDKILSHHLR